MCAIDPNPVPFFIGEFNDGRSVLLEFGSKLFPQLAELLCRERMGLSGCAGWESASVPEYEYMCVCVCVCVCERERVRETSARFFRFSISMLRRSSSYLAEMARSTCTRSESRPIWCCVSVSACACVYEWMRVLKYQLAHVGGGGEGVDGSVVLLVRPLVCVPGGCACCW